MQGLLLIVTTVDTGQGFCCVQNVSKLITLLSSRVSNHQAGCPSPVVIQDVLLLLGHESRNVLFVLCATFR
jgi:hypothetical protein